MALTCGLTIKEKIQATARYLYNRINKKPLLVTLELTQHCNAKCDFCNCWKINNSPKLGNYKDIVKKLNPLIVALSGGEPMLLKNLPDIIRDINNISGYRYIYMVTNGSLLTLEKAKRLYENGLDQFSISLNFIGEKHDKERKIPGLYDHIIKIIPKLTNEGLAVVLNTVIKNDNLADIVPIAKQAYEFGAKISFSCYTNRKNGNENYWISKDNITELNEVINSLIGIKNEKGHITNSVYYLKKIPEYFLNRGISNCQAGKAFIQLTPDGFVRRCPDFAPEYHYTEYKIFPKTDCTQCWYSCRGETEAGLTWGRAIELIKKM
jgi:MoaA/NifB/PqqE/SkfB family radical SAM enzyme